MSNVDAEGVGEKIRGCVCAMTDITQLMNAQSALEESQMRAKQLVESALMGIVVYDKAGEDCQNNHCVAWNSAQMPGMDRPGSRSK